MCCRIPIGHGEGNYFAPPDMLQTIEANRQVVLRYTDPQGRVDDASNPNGSVNAHRRRSATSARNVVGMMPHPERACEALLGGVDGCAIFEIDYRASPAESLALHAVVARVRAQGFQPEPNDHDDRSTGASNATV